MSAAREAARRLGVRFPRCSQCKEVFPFIVENERFSVMQNQTGDYDEGTNEVFLCCTKACADLKLASLPEGSGFVWRTGPCGGTVMP